MTTSERKSRKIYYTMGEVSEMFDVNPSLIRFWEQKFDILKPDKNKKGNRLFTPKDVENLKLIYHLVKENGMTLAGAAKRLRQNREGVSRDLEIIEKLQRVRSLLLDVREVLKADDDGREVFVDPRPTGTIPRSWNTGREATGNRPAAGCRENRRSAQRRSATGLSPLRIRPFGTRPMTRHPVPAKGRGPS